MLFSIEAAPTSIPTGSDKSSPFSASSPALVTSCLFDDSHPDGGEAVAGPVVGFRSAGLLQGLGQVCVPSGPWVEGCLQDSQFTMGALGQGSTSVSPSMSSSDSGMGHCWDSFFLQKCCL